MIMRARRRAAGLLYESFPVREGVSPNRCSTSILGLVSGKITKTLLALTREARRSNACGPGSTCKLPFSSSPEFRTGCLIGNFTMETSNQSTAICRQPGAKSSKTLSASVAYWFSEAAVEAGEELPSENERERNRELCLRVLAARGNSAGED